MTNGANFLSEDDESVDLNTSINYALPVVILGSTILCAAIMGLCYYCTINRNPEVTMANAHFIMGDVSTDIN